MSSTRRVLVVDPVQVIPSLSSHLLPGWSEARLGDLDEARQQLLGRRHHVGLIAWDLGGGRAGVDFLRELSQRACSTPLLLAVDGGSVTSEQALAALEAEACECVLASDPAACGRSVAFAHRTHARCERHSALLLSAYGTSLAHEGKNALAGIGGALQILSDKHAPAPPILGEVRQRLDELTMFVDSLAFLMRQPPPQEAPVPLSQLLMALESGGARIELTGDELTLRGDPHHLARMLASLLEVAGLRRTERARLQARADRRQAQGELRLACAGPLQIDPEVISNPLTAPPTIGRQGLDLHLAMRIAEAHGGELRIDPSDPEVVVRLPLWVDAAEAASVSPGEQA